MYINSRCRSETNCWESEEKRYARDCISRAGLSRRGPGRPHPKSYGLKPRRGLGGEDQLRAGSSLGERDKSQKKGKETGCVPNDIEERVNGSTVHLRSEIDVRGENGGELAWIEMKGKMS